LVAKKRLIYLKEAIIAISEAAEGGLRDALSMLDQAISYADAKVTIEEVNEVTGNVNSDKMIELANQFEEKDINAALEIIDELISMGREVLKLVNGLLQFYRDALLYKNVK
jgi:DNA polymerase-3 subunit gamma/tau